MIVLQGAMPDICKRCKKSGGLEDGLYLIHTEEDFVNFYCDGQSSKTCPIKGKIPDVHGDLIERSHILDKVKDEWRKIREEKGYDVMSDFWLALCKVIEEAPTVLEASKWQ